MNRNLKIHPHLVVFSLFAVSFGYRFFFMNGGLFNPDEVRIAQAVETSFRHHVLAAGPNGRFGTVLLNLLLYVPYNLVTGLDAEKIVLFSAILSGALAVPLLYLLTFELTEDRTAGMMAALFLNFNMLFLTTSTTGKEQTHLVFFLLLALYLVLTGLKRDSAARRTAGFVLYSFSLTTHEAGIALIPVGTILLVLSSLSLGRGARPLVLDLVAFAAALSVPFLLYLGSVFSTTLTTVNPGVPVFEGILTSRLNSTLPDLLLAAGPPLLVLFPPGIFLVFEKRAAFFTLAFWLLLFFYFGNLSTYSGRYLVPVIVPIAACAGMTASWLIRRSRRLSIRWTVGALLAIAACGYGIAMSYPILDYRKHYSAPKQMALFVRDRTEPDALVIIMDEAPYIEYYGKRRVLQHPMEDPERTRLFVEELRRMALAGANIYITSTTCSYDYDGDYRRRMAAAFQYVFRGIVTDEENMRSELALKTFPSYLHKVVPREARSPG